MKSENLDKLIPALIKAQGELQHAAKASSNPHFKSKYADLATVLDTCKPVLQANGLAITHQRMSTMDAEHLVTTLWHSSGQYLSSTSRLMPTKQDPQGFGSAMTYARRYDLSALIGLASDDDDGNAASSSNGGGVANENTKNLGKAFKSAALRNEFVKNVESAFERALNLSELVDLMEVYRPKFDEMKAGGNEYDLMALESLRLGYVTIRKRLEKPIDEPEDDTIPPFIREMDEKFKEKAWQA